MPEQETDLKAFNILTQGIIPPSEVGVKEIDPKTIVTKSDVTVQEEPAPLITRGTQKTKPDPEVIEDEPAEEEEENDYLTIVAKELYEKGVLEEEPADINGDEDKFMELFEKTINKKIQAWKEGLGSEALEVVNYLENGGKLSDLIETAPDLDYETIKLEDNEDLQRQVVKDLYLKEGYSAEEAAGMVTDFENTGLLEKQAKRALERLKAYSKEEKEALVQSQAAAKQQQERMYYQRLKSLKDLIDGKEEIMGEKLTPREREKFFDYMTKIDRRTGKTQLMQDIEKDKNYQLHVAWKYYKGLTEEKIQKRAETKVASKIKEALSRSQETREKLSKGIKTDSASAAGIDYDVLKAAVRL